MPTKSNNARSRMVRTRLPYTFNDVLLKIAQDADPEGILEMYDPKTNKIVNEAAVIKHAIIYRYNVIGRNGYESDHVSPRKYVEAVQDEDQ